MKLFQVTLIALVLVLGIGLTAWRLSPDRKAYIVIVDHDVNDQMLSCGFPAITSDPNGSYFVHVHDQFGGHTFLSGKVVTISTSVTDKEVAECKESK